MNNQTVTSSSDLKTFGSGVGSATIDKPEGSTQVGGTPTRKQSFQTYEVSSERGQLPRAFQGVFALSNDYGSISLSNELITSFQGSCNESASKLAIKKLSKYFEIHYKHTYSIRTSQDFKLEYLRLPQSSINKNE